MFRILPGCSEIYHNWLTHDQCDNAIQNNERKKIQKIYLSYYPKICFSFICGIPINETAKQDLYPAPFVFTVGVHGTLDRLNSVYCSSLHVILSLLPSVLPHLPILPSFLSSHTPPPRPSSPLYPLHQQKFPPRSRYRAVYPQRNDFSRLLFISCSLRYLKTILGSLSL